MLLSEINSSALDRKAKASPDRVFKIDMEGKPFFVKQVTQSKKSGFHLVQSWLAALIRQGFLKSTAIEGGAAALLSEYERFLSYHKAGLYVPQARLIDERYLILEDMGPTLKSLIEKTKDDLDMIRSLILKGFQAMIELHGKGFCHGRLTLNDMCLTKDDIYFIDLEEDPLSCMSLKDAQLRDMILFFHSCGKYKIDFKALASDFYKIDFRPDIRLRAICRFLVPFAYLLKPVAHKIGRDVKQAVAGVFFLNDYLSLFDFK